MKATYVDGFVFVVSKGKKTADYKKMCAEAKEVWMKFGALDYKECMIDDSNPAKSKYTFNTMTKAKPGEAVWFSFITFKDKAHRTKVNKQVMAHFDKKYADKKDHDMPFDMRRMAYGGFKVVVGA
jgi:uncharacterized protein YbaA (DUF1428 family)